MRVGTIIASLISLLSLSAGATTYYVDPVGGSDINNGTSQLTAWAHVPGAVGFTGAGWVTLNNGDILYVKGGSINSYQVLFDNSHYNGSATLDSIQIRSGDVIGWGTGRAVFDQQNTRTYGLALGFITGVRVNRLEIENVAAGCAVIWGLCSAGIEVGGNGPFGGFFHIDDCYIHDTIRALTDQGHGIEFNNANQDGASSCLIEHNFIGNNTPGNIGTKGIEFYGTNNTVRNNFISGSQDHGIVCSGNRNDINGNTVYMLPPYVHQPMFGIKVNFNNNDVWNNLVYTYLITTNTTFNSLDGIGTLDNASYNRILFNDTINCYDLSASQRVAGFSIGDENAAGTNNTIGMNISAFCGSTAGTFNDVQLYLGDLTTNCIIQYNDFFRTSGSASVIADHFGGVYTYLTAAAAVAASPINGNTFDHLQQQDPVFKGGPLPTGLDGNFHPNTPYFQLQNGSPSAVTSAGKTYSGTTTNGASSAANKFSTDILGMPRTLYSMGAYEFNPFPPTVTNVTAIFK